jgi:hypothetical protein
MTISGRYHSKQSGNRKGIKENCLPIQAVPTVCKECVGTGKRTVGI